MINNLNLRRISNVAFDFKFRVMCEAYGTNVILQRCFSQCCVETALVRVYNIITRAFNERTSVVLVPLDLSTAFDTVDHDGLLIALKASIGMNRAAPGWVEFYSNSRTQYVVIKLAHPSMTKFKYGLPQGSVLRPVLFTT